MMKKVLVTGGAGFIGSNFVKFLLENEPGVEIINLDLLTYAGLKANLPVEQDRHLFVHGDINDTDLVQDLMGRHRIDTIVHFAAESHVDRSIVSPFNFVRTNVLGTHTLLDAARQAWQADFSGKRFHHVSTDEVYGDIPANAVSCTEFANYQPRSPYAASKASSDHMVRAYFHTYGFPVTISLASNNYGPFQFPEKLVPVVILSALQGRQIPLYGDGGQIRDWVYVSDHCRAIYQILLHGKTGDSYNIAGGNQLRNVDLVNKICSILDRLSPAAASYASQVVHVPDRPGHDRRYALDSTKLHTKTGWQPEHAIEAGLDLTVHWYLENQSWVSAAAANIEHATWHQKPMGSIK
jgi:dTDP-glucose 4,6-dehydratase